MAETFGVRRMKLGSQGFEVSAQGLCCMSLSSFYGPPKPESVAIPLLHHTINSGVTFLDTSDFYGPETNELLLGKALKDGFREKVELATKFGITASEDGKFGFSGDPKYVRSTCEASLRRLGGVTSIDLYYHCPHRSHDWRIEEACGRRELGIGIVAYSPLGKEASLHQDLSLLRILTKMIIERHYQDSNRKT